MSPPACRTMSSNCDNHNSIMSEQCRLVKEMDYQQVLEATGRGKLSYLAVMASSVGLLAVGFQNGVTAYLLPIAKCDLQLTTTLMGLINAAFMIGGISSACLWGVLSSILGARWILLMTFICDGITCIFSSWAKDPYTLLLCRTLNGFFIGGPGCLIFTYLVDMLHPALKNKCLCCAGLTFIMSWILLPGLLLVVPALENTMFTHPHSWRLYLLLVSTPSLLCVALFYKLPESPKFLLQNGQVYEAVIVLRHMYTCNTRKSGKHFLMSVADDTVKMISSTEPQHSAADRQNRRSRLRKLTREALRQMGELFNRQHLANTITLSAIFFVNMFGCYGFGLWIPEMMEKMEARQSSQMVPCNNTSIHHMAVGETISVGVWCLLYNITTCLVCHYIGERGVRVLPSFSMCLGGAACAALPLLPHHAHLALASLFQAAMTTSNILIVTLTMEAYSPPLRSMAVCVVTMWGRVGSICSNLMFGSHTEHLSHYHILITLVAILSLVGGFLVMCVTLHRPHPSTTHEQHEAAQVHM